MALDTSFIKLFRKMKDWEWYKDNNTKSLFLHCLIEANYQDNEWQGIVIKRGSFVTSLFSLSRDLGISIQSLRTSISKLKKSKNLTYESTNKFTIITVCNFEIYQSDKLSKQQAKQQSTNKQLTNNQQTTNNNIRIIELEKERIENEIDKSISQKCEKTLFEKTIEDFKEMRNKIKEPMTAKAEELLLSKLIKLAGDDENLKIEILEQSILNNWKGVFPIKENNQNQQKPETEKVSPEREAFLLSQGVRLNKPYD